VTTLRSLGWIITHPVQAAFAAAIALYFADRTEASRLDRRDRPGPHRREDGARQLLYLWWRDVPFWTKAYFFGFALGGVTVGLLSTRRRR